MLKIILLLAGLLTSACGFLTDQPVENQDLYVSRDPLGPACELDPERLGRIFDEDVEDQIICLRQNFEQFSRFVLTNNRDVITEGDLQQFIRKFFSQNSQTIIKSLQVLFELNMVMLRDHASNLSRDNITPLTQLLINVNKEGIIITRLLRTLSGPDRFRHYRQARSEIQASLERLVEQTKTIMSETGRGPQALNLRNFVLNLDDSFGLSNNILTPELLDSLIFLKKIFVGGDRILLTSEEMLHLLTIAPKLFIESIDLMFAETKLFENEVNPEVALLEFYQQKILSLRSLLHPIADDAPLFDQDDLHRIYDSIIKSNDENAELPDLNDYRQVLRSFKKHLIGGHPEQYNFGELNTVLLFINLGIEFLITEKNYQPLRKQIHGQAPEYRVLHRPEFIQFAKDVTAKVRTQLRLNPSLPANLQVIEFLKTLSREIDSFTLEDNLINAIAAGKLQFFGGQREIITPSEIYSLLDQIESYAHLTFDLKYILPVLKDSPLSTQEFLQEQIARVRTLSPTHDPELLIFTHQNVQALINFAIKDEEDQIKYDQLYQSFKNNILRTPDLSLNSHDIHRVFELLDMGTEFMNFVDFHKEMNDEFNRPTRGSNYSELKARYIDRFDQMTQTLGQALNSAGVIENDIYYYDFLMDVLDHFDQFDFDRDLLAELKPFKRLLLGGDEDTLSNEQFNQLLNKSRLMIGHVLDLLYQSDEVNDLNFVEIIKVLKSSILEIDTEDELLNLKSLLILAEQFIDMPLRNFAPTVEILKEKVLGGIKETLSGVEIGRLLEMGQELFEIRYFNDVTYRHVEARLNASRVPLVNFPVYQLPEYQNLPQDKLGHYHELFKDVLIKHRYFRNTTDGMQHWGPRVFRNREGVLEMASLKWLVTHAVKAWGSPQPQTYQGYALTIKEVEQALLDARPILEEFGLWTANFDTFARNMLLLGDLFQNRSNGDTRLDIDELAEYGLMVFSAVELNNRFMEKLSEYCEPLEGDSPATWLFETPCYRSHFFRIIMDEFEYAKYLPMLDRYVKENPAADIAEFLRSVEGFARDIDDEAIPMKRRDFVLIIGALINIETTFVRFDSNRDNIVDGHELDAAFLVYENSIIQIANLNEGSRKYAKSIFLYMIQYKAIPSQFDLLLFHYNPFAGRNINALRLNIGILLYYLVK